MGEAVELLRKGNGKVSVISGGTDLLHGFKDHIYSRYPELVVNLRSATEGEYIKEENNWVSIGALTTLHNIERSELLKSQYRVLAQAASVVASPQIRNNATVGGNICQQPRCWYYRNADDLFTCLRKGGTFCSAMTGHNEIHSIFGSVDVGTTPCRSGCPAGSAIPSYFARIREGDYMEAAKMLLRTNPLAAVTGRVCPATCEEQCNRGNIDDALSIRSIERAVGDFILGHQSELISVGPSTGKKVAIVGSGPAGLAAAFYLREQGHSVRVFDKMPKAGGMLRYGIPSYRLPKSVVDAQIGLLENMGVEFYCNTEVGKQVKLSDLRKEYDAVFLASGAWSPVSIHIENEDKTLPAMEFLADVASGRREKPGDKVIVVGGGNVAMDAAITSRRLGAKEVVIVCLEDWGEMPAFKDEVQEALDEGINIEPRWGPNRVLLKDGKVVGLETIKCTSVFDENGCFSPKYDNSIKEVLDSDSVILAVGQRCDLSYIELELGISDRVITADPETQVTSASGLFAGGDAVSGPASVVKALAAGRRAVFTIDEYLGGAHKESIVSSSELKRFDSYSLSPSHRAEMAELSKEERGIDKEDALGFSLEQVKTEVKRCYNCGCVAACPSDTATALVALGAKIKTTKRVIDAEKFFAAGVLSSTVLEPDELVTEIRLPKAQNNTKSVYMKFRHRQAIDFPLVSVASVIRNENGKIAEASIVLGAVAPIPVRAKEAEHFLKGKEVNEEVAAKAADLAVNRALPLGKNHYKVQVAKTLVKRSILACC